MLDNAIRSPLRQELIAQFMQQQRFVYYIQGQQEVAAQTYNLLVSIFNKQDSVKLSPCVPFNNLSSEQLLGVFLCKLSQSDGSKFYY